MNHPHATHIKVVAIIHLVLGALGLLLTSHHAHEHTIDFVESSPNAAGR